MLEKLLSYVISHVAHRRERGQTLVEYGIILSMISVVVVIALVFLGPTIVELFSDTGENLQ